MNSTEEMRQSSIAGTFYPADKIMLDREISLLLEAAPFFEIERPIRSIIAPHAGYVYSGGVAARAYSQILGKNYQYVVVIAPSHEDEFSFISIFNGDGYQTPLGDVHIAKIICQRLLNFHQDIRLSHIGHSPGEHSLEVQLPFLQYAIGDFNLIPISMGEQSKELIQVLSSGLLEVLPVEETLIVASSDLSHFYSDEQARSMDHIAKNHIETFNEEKLWNDIREHRIEMCGYGPVITAMKTARQMGADQIKVLLYRNSSDITGDKSRVVGYLSAVIY